MVIKYPDNTIALVNKNISLPPDYIPKDLIIPNIYFYIDDDNIEKRLLRQNAAYALEKLFYQMYVEQLKPFGLSAYRSYQRQQEIYTQRVKEMGTTYTEQYIAAAGHSEHQTGLAIDLSCPEIDYHLIDDFEHTKEGQWIAKHSYQYGFTLRYPKNKVDITGYQYEPWHLRYVGKNMSYILYENNWVLEEFYQHYVPNTV